MPEQSPVTRTHGLPRHLITKFCKVSEPFRKHSDKNQTRKQKEASQKTVQSPGAAPEFCLISATAPPPRAGWKFPRLPTSSLAGVLGF